MANNYNPDVLNCIANLSNDEVFTPPALANQILDMLPQEIFTSPKTTFLDPFTKSGVFLREIVKRLDRGLESQIHDRQQRIDHIMHKQVFGIACTELTAHLSRRSLYCSKYPNGEYSVSHFDDRNGNILYSSIKHTWNNKKCIYCGATQGIYDRNESDEQYAYPFIHTKNPQVFFDMKFDVIVGNPPYQLSDGSGASSDAAMPIYNKFVEQAMRLNPRFLTMIIPSKWMVGGRGLQKFRKQMLDDSRIKYLFDFEDASTCFPGVHIDGGVCFFLWDSLYKGPVEHHFISNDGTKSIFSHYLKNDYFDYVIREKRAISIIDKISKEVRFSSIVSSTKPYGIRKYLFNTPDRYPEAHLSEKPYKNSVEIFGVKGIKGGARRVSGYIARNSITAGVESIDKYKIFFTTSFSTNAITPPEPIIGNPGTVCTETFLQIGPFQNSIQQKNCFDYMHTNFFKFLLYYGKGTMQVTKNVFELVPLVDFDASWNDSALYAKFKLQPDEIEFINSLTSTE